MAYLCINGWGKECDGCMCCQEDYTEPECDYSKSFNEEVDKLCEAISDDLRALRDLVEEYQSKDLEELTEDMRVVERYLGEMESALNWIY